MAREQLVGDLTVDELRGLIRQELSPSPPAYYTQENSPLGHRKHLELCRSGDLKAHRVGRSMFVRAEDLHAFIDLSPRVGPDPDEKPKKAPKAETERRRGLSREELLRRARSVPDLAR